jgi:hypothetical protein
MIIARFSGQLFVLNTDNMIASFRAQLDHTMKTKLSLLALAALLFVGLPLHSSSAYVAVSVGIAPPPIVAYEQPYCPGPGYIWTPGYWGYGEVGYYWVPGAWILPPTVGLYWTPGYWAYGGGHYRFIDGYWGPTIGFYGGVNYGYGYYGNGYVGGQWVGSTFRYNTAVSRVDTAVIHDTYVNKSVVKNSSGKRASFNGPGGTKAKPNAREQAAAKADHVPATSAQRSQAETAKNDPSARAKNRNPETANTAQGKNKQQANATKADRSATQDRTGNTQQTRGKTAKTTERSHPATKSTHNAHAGVTHNQKASQTRHTVEARKAAGPHRSVATKQQVQHRPQTKAAPRASGHGTANGPENSKKKKKDKDQGNG